MTGDLNSRGRASRVRSQYILAFGDAAFPTIVFWVGILREEGAELRAQGGGGFVVFRFLNEIRFLTRIILHVVKFIRPGGMPESQLPLRRANHARVLELMEDHILPLEGVAGEGAREAFARQRGIGGRHLFEVEIFQHGGEEVVIRDHQFRPGAGTNAPGLPEDERDADRRLAGVEGTGVIAHAPKPAVPGVEALIGGKDYEGALIQTEAFQGGHDLPDAVVHAADGGGVAAHAGEVADGKAIGAESGIDGFAGEGVHGLVGVIGGVPVGVDFADDVSEAVRAVVGEIKEEWFVAMLLEEVNGVFGDGVGCIARFTVNLAVPYHAVVVKSPGVAAFFREPIAEAELGTEIVAQMPLTRQPRIVAGFGKNRRQRAELGDGRIRFWPDLTRRWDVSMHSVLRGN